MIHSILLGGKEIQYNLERKKVKNINLDEQTVDIVVSMFGRETAATLSITQVKRAEE